MLKKKCIYREKKNPPSLQILLLSNAQKKKKNLNKTKLRIKRKKDVKQIMTSFI